MKTKYSVVGLGKLGSSMVAAIAARGFGVIGVDTNQDVVELVDQGKAPVQETDLEATLQVNRERIQATLSYQDAVMNSDVTFVVVPTPSDERGAFSLQYVAEVFKGLGQALRKKDEYHLVVLTSTVLPGSTRYGLLPILEQTSGKSCGPDFGLCYSPEFIALGSVIHDFLNPDFALIGEFDEQSGNLLESCYVEIMENDPPCQRMSLENAELTKVALNTFVTSKITFANMLADLCERIPGGDVDVVTDALGLDKRIGRKYLTGALGYGGPCFPRDNIALNFIAEVIGTHADLAKTTDRMNRSIPGKFVERLLPDIHQDDVVAVLGLAYKPQSHVTEESQGVYLAKSLVEEEINVVAYDPLVGDVEGINLLDSVEDCLAQADVVLITTPDPEFKTLQVSDFASGKSVLVVDFWRILSEVLTDQPDIKYIPVGCSIDDEQNANRLAEQWKTKEEAT
jgi:UDPglucose 6-dehydrogenase